MVLEERKLGRVRKVMITRERVRHDVVKVWEPLTVQTTISLNEESCQMSGRSKLHRLIIGKI
jgi:hypothetical protein